MFKFIITLTNFPAKYHQLFHININNFKNIQRFHKALCQYSLSFTVIKLLKVKTLQLTIFMLQYNNAKRKEQFSYQLFSFSAFQLINILGKGLLNTKIFSLIIDYS